MFRRHLALATTLALSLPAAARAAEPQWGGQVVVQWGSPAATQAAYREGYDRGVRAGRDDVRRGDRFRYDDEADYRRADSGYDSRFGSRDRYRSEFQRGFADGYRIGYGQDDRYRNLPPGRGGQAPWANGRGSAYGRYDLASANGYSDGYEAGLDDARDRRRFDPIGESRYRSGDHGYKGSYGSRERYKDTYRVAFRDGYEEGFRDGSRYDRRW